MAGSDFTRAKPCATHPAGDKEGPRPAFHQADLPAVARYMVSLMLRNVTSDGFVLNDPANPGHVSVPGCIIAAPSFPANTPGVDQDYVFNWVRDAAVVAMEIAEARLPAGPDGGVPALDDYVAFARLCQRNAAPTLGHACFTLDGRPRPWSEQNDGPALQCLAMLRIFDQLGEAARATARDILDTNLRFLLDVYRDATVNLWEEYEGLSFFVRAVQLRCFAAIARNTIGIAVPPGLESAHAWLAEALDSHWNGTLYASVLAPAAPGAPPRPISIGDGGYDPNIDIVCAAIYGHVPCTDTRLLATAGLLRRQWADPSSPLHYPVNAADRAHGIGPLLGRYPGDHYDGDVSHPQVGGHPWPLCTCNMAELYFRLASAIGADGSVPLDDLSRDFFADLGVTRDTLPVAVAGALRAAGDAMLRAVILHSDRYELSEQFDGTTGYEKSVRNLTWSYAAFLSAVRARGT